nr:uncharacterized protein LOC100177264 isoform X1 [Ciona intestinalis]|eukprot:XP_002122315.1 uncharacterized protein LOC100177264 isoform X1 [Ciona intestinalis]
MADFEDTRNPDGDFVLQGRKTPIRQKSDDYLSNTQKTLTSKNLSSSLNLSGSKKGNPSIEELEHSLNELKFDLENLNESLRENYGKTEIFLGEDLDSQGNACNFNSGDEDPELTHLLQRDDHEAVSHTRPYDPKWFSDPKHRTKPMGDYPMMQSLGVTRRGVSPVNRSIGRYGAEIATKDVTGQLTAVDLASNEKNFPIRLSAPHIVGVRSLLPPKFPVQPQDKEKAKSARFRSRSLDARLNKSFPITSRMSRSRNKSRARDRSPSPLPAWMPTSSRANASAQPPPPVKKRGRSPMRKRPATATGHRDKEVRSVWDEIDLSKSLPLAKTRGGAGYVRPTVQPQPGHLELSFLRAADQIDTRRALVENSPYQQKLAKLRLERLRVEEEYLLQLKRESELERIRGPKPKWYESKGPEFHYECNKNTALHKNRDNWSDTMDYRNHLLKSSREFTMNMRGPVPVPR